MYNPFPVLMTAPIELISDIRPYGQSAEAGYQTVVILNASLDDCNALARRRLRWLSQLMIMCTHRRGEAISLCRLAMDILLAKWSDTAGLAGPVHSVSVISLCLITGLRIISHFDGSRKQRIYIQT